MAFRVTAVLVAVLLAACGGGSGGPQTANETAPTLRAVLTGGPFPALGTQQTFDAEAPFAAFELFSGLGSESELVQHDQADLTFLQQQAGRTSYSNLVLKRGVVSAAFQTWRRAIESGRDVRLDLQLTLLQPDGRPLGGFRLLGASVVRLTAAGLPSRVPRGDATSTEEIELVIERLERD